MQWSIADYYAVFKTTPDVKPSIQYSSIQINSIKFNMIDGSD